MHNVARCVDRLFPEIHESIIRWPLNTHKIKSLLRQVLEQSWEAHSSQFQPGHSEHAMFWSDSICKDHMSVTQRTNRNVQQDGNRKLRARCCCSFSLISTKKHFSLLTCSAHNVYVSLSQVTTTEALYDVNFDSLDKRELLEAMNNVSSFAVVTGSSDVEPWCVQRWGVGWLFKKYTVNVRRKLTQPVILLVILSCKAFILLTFHLFLINVSVWSVTQPILFGHGYTFEWKGWCLHTYSMQYTFILLFQFHIDGSIFITLTWTFLLWNIYRI